MSDATDPDLLDRATALLSVGNTEAASALCLLDIARSLHTLTVHTVALVKLQGGAKR